jgi:GDP-L-fucose synthase
MANAVVFAIENQFEESIYNVGTGNDLSIKKLAELVQRIVGHTGEIIWDSNKPDGTPRKLMDVSKLNSLGWKSRIGLEEGIRETYNWYCNNIDHLKLEKDVR